MTYLFQCDVNSLSLKCYGFTVKCLVILKLCGYLRKRRRAKLNQFEYFSQKSNFIIIVQLYFWNGSPRPWNESMKSE